jgi:hypothetical protein
MTRLTKLSLMLIDIACPTLRARDRISFSTIGQLRPSVTVASIIVRDLA